MSSESTTYLDLNNIALELLIQKLIFTFTYGISMAHHFINEAIFELMIYVISINKISKL